MKYTGELLFRRATLARDNLVELFARNRSKKELACYDSEMEEQIIQGAMELFAMGVSVSPAEYIQV